MTLSCDPGQRGDVRREEPPARQEYTGSKGREIGGQYLRPRRQGGHPSRVSPVVVIGATPKRAGRDSDFPPAIRRHPLGEMLPRKRPPRLKNFQGIYIVDGELGGPVHRGAEMQFPSAGLQTGRASLLPRTIDLLDLLPESARENVYILSLYVRKHISKSWF